MFLCVSTFVVFFFFSLSVKCAWVQERKSVTENKQMEKKNHIRVCVLPYVGELFIYIYKVVSFFHLHELH